MSEDCHEIDPTPTRYYHCTCCLDRHGSVGESCMCVDDHCTECNRCLRHCKQPALHAIVMESLRAEKEFNDRDDYYAGQPTRRCGDRRPHNAPEAYRITAEDCALLWACGIRVDEDMPYANVRVQV